MDEVRWPWPEDSAVGGPIESSIRLLSEAEAEGPAPGAALVAVFVAAYGAYVARGMFVSLRWRAMFKGMSNVSVDLPPNVSRAKHITMTEYIREYGLFRQYTEFTNARLTVENREKAAASKDAARQPVKLKSWR